MIKKIYLFSTFVMLTFFTVALCFAENQRTRFIFKDYMHEMSLNFKHARRSMGLNKYPIAAIHLKHMQEIIKKLPGAAPQYNMDGTQLNRKNFEGRLIKLNEALVHLREALRKNDTRGKEKLPKQVFNICMGCHDEAKVKYLFGLTGLTPTFKEYMHSIDKSYKRAVSFQKKNDFANTNDYLKLINYYLPLLKDSFPDKGPSGIIMDRNRLIQIIRKVEIFIEQMDVREKKSIDLGLLRKRLNEICIACHEPERIKQTQ